MATNISIIPNCIPDLDNKLSVNYDSNLLCNYLAVNEIDKFLEYPVKNEHVYNCMHVNCRSLPKNYNNLLNLLDMISEPVSAIAVTETWLNPTVDDLYNIPGYHFYSQPRTCRRGGGVGIFLLDIYSAKIRTDLCTNSDTIECIFIELPLVAKRCLVIGCIYRPPGTDMSIFNSRLLDILKSIDAGASCDLVILGDFNADMLKVNTHLQTGCFFDNMQMYSLLPVISIPTRITDSSATLIDNIFVNCSNHTLKSGVIYYDVSDHLPIITQINLRPPRTKLPLASLHAEGKRRPITPEKVENFNNSLLKKDLWAKTYEILQDTGNADSAMITFHDTYVSLFRSHFPMEDVRRRRGRGATVRREWMTIGLVRSCRKKAKLLKKYKRTNHHNDKKKYLSYLTVLKKILKNAERSFYADKFSLLTGNLKKTWSLITALLNKKPISEALSVINVNGNTITDKTTIANNLNNYFVGIGKTLASKIPPENVTYDTFLKKNFPNSFQIDGVSSSEIVDLVNGFEGKSSAGADEIPMSVLKSTILNVSEPLAKIINSSILTGTFPDILKISKICPIYKTGPKTEIENYHPISLLSSFSKVFEKIMHNRLMCYLNKHDILTNSQYGFRKNHSSCMSLIDLYNRISHACDNNQFAIGIFLDLSKAFDTVDHEILLNKLSHYGIRGLAKEWFASYLANRSQFVDLQGVRSTCQKISCGVPQGSVLGPLLFVLYINDIVASSSLLKFIIFADDTNLFYSDSDVVLLQRNVNIELSKLSVWFRANKLSLNISKSNYILFGHKLYPSVFTVMIDNLILNHVNTAKFLGITVDEKLTWGPHIKQTATKIAKAVGAINRVKNILPQRLLLSLYYTLVYPHLIYCNIVWGGACDSHTGKLFILQKRVVRIIENCYYLAPTTPIFKNHSMLKLKDIHVFLTAQFMYKVKLRLLPTICLVMFQICLNKHYATRMQNYFVYCVGRTSIRQKSINFYGPRLWHTIPMPIQQSVSLFLFNKSFREYLVSYYI